MTTTNISFYPKLASYIDSIIAEAGQIPAERKELLGKLATYIQKKLSEDSPVKLNFICTHNSRRSHISQLWTAAAAAWYGIDSVQTFSGGTEATAFNPRAVDAMTRAGFQIENPGGDNPHYQVSFAEGVAPVESFSKTYDDPFNPEKGFAAIMTCSDADENCPFIPGVDMRLPLTYNDPKEADDTPEETGRYDERVRQIGREIFYAMGLVDGRK